MTLFPSVLDWMKLKREWAWGQGMRITKFIFPSVEETAFLKMLVNADPRTWEVAGGVVKVSGVLISFSKRLPLGRTLYILEQEKVQWHVF